jgi:Transposase and inactivated derivatives
LGTNSQKGHLLTVAVFYEIGIISGEPPSLTIPSILIMDNAPIHCKTAIKLLVKEVGHQILFLPKYSPDLNDIEHDFSTLKLGG